MRRILPTTLLFLAAGSLSACSDAGDPLAPRPTPAAPLSAERATQAAGAAGDVRTLDDVLERVVPALASGPKTSRLRAALQHLRAARLAGDAPGAARQHDAATALVAELEAELGPDAWADLGAITLALEAQR